jgi:hypothetical protein
MKKPNGVVLYRGPSMLDGAPIVVIATGIAKRSRNGKTGDIVQTWILREDMSPKDAVNSGDDASICGNCPHRGTLVTVIKNGVEVTKNVNRSCYVTIFQAPRNIWSSYHRGIYRAYQEGDLAGRKVRLGAYGDPAAVPASVWQDVLATASGWTGYTHQWREHDALQAYVMASCDTMQDYIDAKTAGWRTFRVRAATDPMASLEIKCPASAEAGKRTSCASCLLCGGTSKLAKDIAIIAHGAASKVNAYAARA